MQLPFVSSSRMEKLRRLLIQHSRHLYYIPFDDSPGKLFDGLPHCRSAIFLSQIQLDSGDYFVFGSKYQRWFSECREHLFRGIIFNSVSDIRSGRGIFPKVANETQISLFHRLYGEATAPISSYLKAGPTTEFVFYQEAMQYWAKATWGLPFYQKNGNEGPPPHGRFIYTEESSSGRSIVSVINSSLFYLYFLTYGDCFHLSSALVGNFPIRDTILRDSGLSRLSHMLMKDLHKNSQKKTIGTKGGDLITYEEFFVRRSKPIIDEIDQVLSQHYGFTEEELDFIINYDIKYRMGREG